MNKILPTEFPGLDHHDFINPLSTTIITAFLVILKHVATHFHYGYLLLWLHIGEDAVILEDYLRIYQRLN